MCSLQSLWSNRTMGPYGQLWPNGLGDISPSLMVLLLLLELCSGWGLPVSRLASAVTLFPTCPRPPLTLERFLNKRPILYFDQLSCYLGDQIFAWPDRFWSTTKYDQNVFITFLLKYNLLALADFYRLWKDYFDLVSCGSWAVDGRQRGWYIFLTQRWWYLGLNLQCT